jgi:hypothetical protein
MYFPLAQEELNECQAGSILSHEGAIISTPFQYDTYDPLTTKSHFLLLCSLADTSLRIPWERTAQEKCSGLSGIPLLSL